MAASIPYRSRGSSALTIDDRLAPCGGLRTCVPRSRLYLPSCDAGPQWCEINHVLEWQSTHRTTLAEGALTCCGDRRRHRAMGWRPTMLHGIPHWIPPIWLDPEQKPIRNTRHDPPPEHPPDE